MFGCVKTLVASGILAIVDFPRGWPEKKTAFNSPASNNQLGVFITFKTFKMLQAFEN